MISYDFASFANTEQRKIRKGTQRGTSFFHHSSSKPLEKIMISVLIADDHAMIRDALQRLLERAGDMKIIAMAFNGLEAVKQAVLHCPNVAVMDVSMPFMDGVEATTQISANCPKTRVLMVSAHYAPNHIHRCIQAGALGYVLKDTVGDELAIAVRSLYQGHRYFSKQIAEVARHYIE
jgi:DNA-binding NarL/FixJ family response regulator